MRKHFVYMFLAGIFAVACSTTHTVNNPYHSQKFYQSKAKASEIISRIPAFEQKMSVIKGKARVQVSRPGETDRGTVYFTADRHHSLLVFKNGLGIEGGQLLITDDSVLVYNRIDHVARKMSIQSYSYAYLNGMAPVNPLQLLAPRLDASQVKTVLENPTSYALVTRDGAHYIIDKNKLVIREITYPENTPDHYSTVLFDDFASISSMMLPRRIQVISSDKKASVFLLIESLDLNPSDVNFHIDLPDNIQVQHF